MQLSEPTEVAMRSVDHAAELSGGYDALAERLGVCPAEVVAWSRGLRTPKTITLLLVLDVIIDETRRLTRELAALDMAQLALEKVRNAGRAR